MSHLSLTGISKSYSASTTALYPMDLQVQSGEFVVLVGPSGCGKSTLLRLVAGLENCTGGTIQLDGREITDVSPSDRDIAMVFQNYALYPHMTVRQNIGFGLKNRNVPKADRERAVSEVAAMLGLDQLLDRTPGQLSGGQRQRVALARAIVRRPKLFLFDEPLSNLDAALRTSTRAEIRRLHHRLGATTLYVTHDQTEAMSMADRLVVLRAGAVEQIGTPLEVYRRPRNRFVATFLGSPAMNILRARVDHGVLQLCGLRWPTSQDFSGAVDVGFRPESLQFTESANGNTISVKVVLTEPMGNEQLVTCVLADGQEAVVRTAAEETLRAAPQYLKVDFARASLFDLASGKSLDSFPGDTADKEALEESEDGEHGNRRT